MAFIVPFIPYIVGAAGALYSANQKSVADEHRGKIDEQNARLTLQQTSVAEDSQRRQMAQNLGTLRASAVQSGFDANTGSLATLQIKSAGEMELDVLTNRYRGQLEAIGLQTDAATSRMNAKNSMRSGYLSAAGTLASGYSNYLQGSKIKSIKDGP